MDQNNIRRDVHGVYHVRGKNDAEIYEGLGFCHATDRAMQMLLMRILGQGRGSELLEASDEMLRIDTFFRRMNWGGDLAPEIARLTPAARTICDSYCQGVNRVWQKKYPWEFKLLGYRPEPWRVEDIMLMSRMTGYLTLAQSQCEIERLLVEMVQADVARNKLDELFPKLLDELDVELVKKIKLPDRIVPAHVLWSIAVPIMMTSNNWALSGSKTASGKPMLASDPHLETNRLPNVWYEVVLSRESRYIMGASMPGLPGVLIGRTPDLAWGATYTYMDSADSWIEECRDGKFKREGEWLPFRSRVEKILRKKQAPVAVTFYENDHGVLEGNPQEAGFYMTTAWSAAKSGATSINAISGILDAHNVEAGMAILGRLETSWNWMLADREGNIGYQMSGMLPKRRPAATGFVPLPGWDKRNDWDGIVDYRELPRCYNPTEGFFMTANNNLNHLGRAKPINICGSGHRAERIGQLLKPLTKATAADMAKIHFDVESLHAQEFMAIMRPLIPDTPQGQILKAWDYRYTPDSEGAYLFEEVYRALLQEVFGKNGLGLAVSSYLAQESATFAAFFDNFDRILLADTSLWFQGQTREAIYRKVLTQALQVKPQAWGKVNRIVMSHLIFGGKFPLCLGFDRGPIVLRGGRATVHQGQVYRNANRASSFAPSFRMVADMSNDEIQTALAGGPSDRRFSKWYCSDLARWFKGEYKTISSLDK